MKSIIKKAIEEGYNSNGIIKNFTPENRAFAERAMLNEFRLLILDRMFWRALGKACGWGECISAYENAYTLGREAHALRFHEINLTQSWSEAVKYLEEVTK